MMFKVVNKQCVAKYDILPGIRIAIPHTKAAKAGDFVINHGGKFFRVFAPFCFLRNGKNPNAELYYDYDRDWLILEITRVIDAGCQVII